MTRDFLCVHTNILTIIREIDTMDDSHISGTFNIIVHSGCISVCCKSLFLIVFSPGNEKRPAGSNPNPAISPYSKGKLRLFTRNCRFCLLFSVLSVRKYKKITQTLYQYLRDWMANPVYFDTRDGCTRLGAGMGALHPSHNQYRIIVCSNSVSNPQFR